MCIEVIFVEQTMRSGVYFPLLTTCTVLCWLAGSGCVSAPREIPTGEWRGTGTFLWHSAEEGSTTRPAGQGHEPLTREYETRLGIEKKEIAGQDAYILKILSYRGKIPKLRGDLTFIRLAMVCMADEDGNWKRYVLKDVDFNVEENLWNERWALDEEKLTKPIPFALVRTYRRKNSLVLHIYYMENWQDTFVFQHDKVCKIGNILDLHKQEWEKAEEIAWVESLEKVK